MGKVSLHRMPTAGQLQSARKIQDLLPGPPKAGDGEHQVQDLQQGPQKQAAATPTRTGMLT